MAFFLSCSLLSSCRLLLSLLHDGDDDDDDDDDEDFFIQNILAPMRLHHCVYVYSHPHVFLCRTFWTTSRFLLLAFRAASSNVHSSPLESVKSFVMMCCCTTGFSRATTWPMMNMMNPAYTPQCTVPPANRFIACGVHSDNTFVYSGQKGGCSTWKPCACKCSYGNKGPPRNSLQIMLLGMRHGIWEGGVFV